MSKILMAILLVICAVTAYAGPAYFDEARVPLSISEVRTDSRYSDMAKWFGLSRDVYTTYTGTVENIPVGSDGKFRWGQDMQKPYPWPAVNPQESQKMPGVSFDLGNGFFLHCQKGIGGNAILFYGKYCLRQPADGRDGANGQNGTNGRDGTDGRDGANGRDGTDGRDGANGRDGCDGRNGRDGKDGQVLVVFPVQQMAMSGNAPPPTPNSVLVWTPTPLGGGGFSYSGSTKIITSSNGGASNAASTSSATGGQGGQGGSACATGGSVGNITNDNSNSNSNANANGTTIAIDGTATGETKADGSSKSTK